MGFGGEVKHRVGPRLGKDPAESSALPDIGQLESVGRRIQRRSEGFGVSRVAQRVQGHDILPGRHQPPHHAGADKACAAGHQQPFHASSDFDWHAQPVFAL